MDRKVKAQLRKRFGDEWAHVTICPNCYTGIYHKEGDRQTTCPECGAWFTIEGGFIIPPDVE